MTGVEWDRFSMLVSLVPHVLVRSRDWETLLHRLTLETSVSTGLEYGHRWEAPCGSAATGPSPASSSSSSRARSSTTTSSSTPTTRRCCATPRTRAGTTSCCAPSPRRPTPARCGRRCRRRRPSCGTAWSTTRSPARCSPSRSTSSRTTASRCAHPQGRASLAVRAESRIFPDASGRARRLRLTATQRRAVRDVLAWTGLERERQDAVRAATLDALARDVPSDVRDPDLAVLLDTALDEPHLDRRDTALAVLLLSPQGRTLGRVVAQDLGGAVDAGDTGRAVADLSMLSFLASPRTSRSCSSSPPAVAATRADVARRGGARQRPPAGAAPRHGRPPSCTRTPSRTWPPRAPPGSRDRTRPTTARATPGASATRWGCAGASTCCRTCSGARTRATTRSGAAPSRGGRRCPRCCGPPSPARADSARGRPAGTRVGRRRAVVGASSSSASGGSSSSRRACSCGSSSWRRRKVSTMVMAAAATGMPMIAPIGPKRAAPTKTDPSATAGWTSIVRRLIRGVKT